MTVFILAISNRFGFEMSGAASKVRVIGDLEDKFGVKNLGG